MGRDRHRDKGRLAPFVPLLKETLATPAWRAMSHGARSLYVSLKLRYSSNFKNNDQIYLSIRDAAKELGSHKDVIGRWFRELQHYGFIVMTSAGCLGVEGKGKAPHWRLTEIGHMTNPPTRDFLRWNGAIFQNFKKQNPVPKSGDRVSLKVGTVVSLKVGTVPDQSVPKSGDIQAGGPVPKSGDITRFTISPIENEQGEPDRSADTAPPLACSRSAPHGAVASEQATRPPTDLNGHSPKLQASPQLVKSVRARDWAPRGGER